MRPTWKQRLTIATGSFVAGIALGVASAYYAFSSAGLKPAAGQTEWQQRTLSDDSATLPYALGHFLANGQLPPPKSVIDLTRNMAGGQVLRGDCPVRLEGIVPQSRWWTLSAVTADGISVGKRSVLTASTAIIEGDGRLIVSIATQPQPGNWIVPPSSGAYTLALTLHDASQPFATLPTLTRDGC